MANTQKADLTFPMDPLPANIISNVRKYAVDRPKIALIVSELSEILGVHHYETCVQFVTAKVMRSINNQFRDKDKSTDVLSFPQYEWKKPLTSPRRVNDDRPVKRRVMNPMPLGDIVISLDDAKANAVEDGSSLDREVCFLIIHGFLHLVGHDHMKAAEKKKMFAEQSKLMTYFATWTPNKKPIWDKCVLDRTSKPKRQK